MIAEASGGDAAGFDEPALTRPGACDFGRDADGILTSLGPTLRRSAPASFRPPSTLLAHPNNRVGACKCHDIARCGEEEAQAAWRHRTLPI